MADALDSDQLISIALLRPPTSTDVLEPIFPTICIGKIVSHVKLDDGRFNLILAGVSRARVVEEMPFEKAYRLAKVDLPVEIPVRASDQEQTLREQIIKLFRRQLTRSASQSDQATADWLDLNLPLGHLCDLVAFASSTNPIEQLAVLEQWSILNRAELVIRMLTTRLEQPSSNEPFPPGFSLN
jgi:Lon protease-like protein